MVVIRYLFVLMVGLVAGAAGTLYVATSGAGDMVIRRTDIVQDLERRLGEMELQRDQLGRQLEAMEASHAKLEKTFDDLTARFQRLATAAESAPPSPPARPVAPPPAGAPGETPSAPSAE